MGGGKDPNTMQVGNLEFMYNFETSDDKNLEDRISALKMNELVSYIK